MAVSVYLEVSAIVLHCVYGIVHWATQMGGNVNTEIAVPLLVGMYWLIAILYLGALVASVIQGGVHSVIATVVFGVVGIHIANLVFPGFGRFCSCNREKRRIGRCPMRRFVYSSSERANSHSRSCSMPSSLMGNWAVWVTVLSS